MKALRLILFPFTFLYGLIIIIRNALYDLGMFKSTKFNLPVISVGNLTAGGAGKTPMIEYLVNLLHNYDKMAILSRGYGRKTRGFYRVETHSSSEDTGDEPLQFKSKFPSLTVAVCEDRVAGIRNLENSNEIILLDDAFQHRRVKPGFSILLFDYNNLIKWQWLLPTGDLREPLSGKKRADCIVITKTPINLNAEDKKLISKKVRPLKDQPIFFSYIDYGQLKSFTGTLTRSLDSISGETSIFLLTGIANPAPLVNQLKKYTQFVHHHAYPDHHIFSPKNMIKLAQDFSNKISEDKIIITTEKDVQRLKLPGVKEVLQGLPVYYLPVKAVMHKPEGAEFDALILNYVTRHLRNN